ncbi:MAG TPA: branched-chain amino acid transaminase [Candidatus Dormibacteraeota bacterium]|nr:branched-chain amino acid transaminase [Candidatus Dormibacteraeota bacterium]
MTTPGETVYFGGEFVNEHEARVPITAHAFNYGTGCFEGIRAYWSEERHQLFVIRLKEHGQRMLRSARILRLEPDPALTEAKLEEIVLELLARNEYQQDAYIRPIIYKGGHTIKVTLGGIPTEFCCYTLPMGDYLDIRKGLRMMTSSWRRIDDNAIPARAKPTGAYLNAALAADEARSLGFDEALMLTHDGHVAEASSANLFMVQDEVVVTPPTSDDLLVGVTRDCVMAMVQKKGWKLEVRQIDRSELLCADEAFLCGTGVQIAPISQIDGRQVGDGRLGEATKVLQDWYLQIVRGEVDDFASWRTAVEPVALPAGR